MPQPERQQGARDSGHKTGPDRNGPAGDQDLNLRQEAQEMGKTNETNQCAGGLETDLG